LGLDDELRNSTALDTEKESLLACESHGLGKSVSPKTWKVKVDWDVKSRTWKVRVPTDLESRGPGKGLSLPNENKYSKNNESSCFDRKRRKTCSC
jgi:hypothetical protein